VPLTNAKMLRLKLDPAKAVPAMISYQYDENADPEAFYEGRTWPTEDGFAYIICRDCGELDERDSFLRRIPFTRLWVISRHALTNDATSARAMGSCGWGCDDEQDWQLYQQPKSA